MHHEHDFERDQLTILYALRAAKIDLREDQLARIFGDLDIMDFFDLKEAIYALTQSGLVNEILTIQGPMYHVTDDGLFVIRSQEADVRLSSRDGLDNYMRDNKARLEKESTYLAASTNLGDGQYRVQARIVSENTPIFHISLLVESKEEADTFIEQWPIKGESMYQHVLLELTV